MMSEEKENRGWRYFLDVFRDQGGGKPGKQGYLLAGLLMLGVLLMFSGSFFRGREEPAPAPGQDPEDLLQRMETAEAGYDRKLQEKLAGLLEGIEGVSNVEVLVTYYDRGEKEYARKVDEETRETSEEDGGGGMREVLEVSKSSEYATVTEADGIEAPLVKTERLPQIKGVLVVGGGLKNERLKLEVLRSLQSILGLPAHRIAVMPGVKIFEDERSELGE